MKLTRFTDPVTLTTAVYATISAIKTVITLTFTAVCVAYTIPVTMRTFRIKKETFTNRYAVIQGEDFINGNVEIK